MKRLVLLAGILVLFVSSAGCASLPKPKGGGSSLVIGSFVMDFPDGFFNEGKRKIEATVTVNFRNITTGQKFNCFTERGGMFYFLTNGSDEFMFESFEYRSSEGSSRYSIGETPLKLKIQTTTDKVIYLGHITFTYAKPTLERDPGSGTTSWGFERSIALNWDKDSTLAFILKKQPNSDWLAREVLEYKMQSEK
jgi:hypothetical protein